MTPRLRIPSSSRRKQRSLSPFLPLCVFSSSPEMCHSSIFVLSLKPPPPPLSLLPLSFIRSWNLHHTHRGAHTEMTFDISRNLKSSCMSLKTMKTNTSLLTLLCLHRATHGCTGRRSTPLQHDGAPPLMTGGLFVRHTLAQHL